MDYNRLLDIISLLAPVVIMWMISLVAYVKMRRRYMKVMDKYVELLSKQAGGSNTNDNAGDNKIEKLDDDMVFDYKRCKVNDERIMTIMDMLRIKETD